MTIDWLVDYAEKAAASDRLRDEKLLAAGLMGEVGSLAAEFKKIAREGASYPVYRERVREELGDCLWYLTRLVAMRDPDLLRMLPASPSSGGGESPTDLTLRLGAALGKLLAAVNDGEQGAAGELTAVWELILSISEKTNSPLHEAAKTNLAKVKSRWRDEGEPYAPFFDDEYPVEEQIPRCMTIDFLERGTDRRKTVLLRCNGIGIGDRITDNIQDPDDYRFHDIFHLAYAVFLGWSPVVRSLLKCKRKSNSDVDENQDGARAAIIEEAVSALVFNRAKQMGFFEDASHVDYDLLKSVEEAVEGFEVDSIPLWQWEQAILAGYRCFSVLRKGPGGRVTVSLPERRLVCDPL